MLHHALQRQQVCVDLSVSLCNRSQNAQQTTIQFSATCSLHKSRIGLHIEDDPGRIRVQKAIDPHKQRGRVVILHLQIVLLPKRVVSLVHRAQIHLQHLRISSSLLPNQTAQRDGIHHIKIELSQFLTQPIAVALNAQNPNAHHRYESGKRPKEAKPTFDEARRASFLSIHTTTRTAKSSLCPQRGSISKS